MGRHFILILTLAFVTNSSWCGGGNNGNQSGTNSNSPVSSGSGKVVFCLYDLSASTEAPAIRKKYDESFKRILEKMNEGDVLVADAITDNPLSRSSFPVNEQFPNFDPKTDNPLIVQKKRQVFEDGLRDRRERISKAMTALLSDQSRKINSTKILDAMQLADRVFRTYNRPKKVLVVFSDMIEESDHCNFQKQRLNSNESERIIQSEKKADRLPDFSGVRVYVIGSAVTGQSSSDRYQSIETFWLQYFKAAGADLPKERYGSGLINFDE